MNGFQSHRGIDQNIGIQDSSLKVHRILFIRDILGSKEHRVTIPTQSSCSKVLLKLGDPEFLFEYVRIQGIVVKIIDQKMDKCSIFLDDGTDVIQVEVEKHSIPDHRKSALKLGSLTECLGKVCLDPSSKIRFIQCESLLHQVDIFHEIRHFLEVIHVYKTVYFRNKYHKSMNLINAHQPLFQQQQQQNQWIGEKCDPNMKNHILTQPFQFPMDQPKSVIPQHQVNIHSKQQDHSIITHMSNVGLGTLEKNVAHVDVYEQMNEISYSDLLDDNPWISTQLTNKKEEEEGKKETKVDDRKVSNQQDFCKDEDRKRRIQTMMNWIESYLIQHVEEGCNLETLIKIHPSSSKEDIEKSFNEVG